LEQVWEDGIRSSLGKARKQSIVGDEKIYFRHTEDRLEDVGENM
jgi:hypothetical protein